MISQKNENKVIIYSINKDFLEEKVKSVKVLRKLAKVKKILRKQQDNGS